MMNSPTASRVEVLDRLEKTGIVAVVRAKGPGHLLPLARALVEGGVEAIELTMTTPGALEAVSTTREALGDRALLGVGSVLDGETARLAILAGADFVVSPILNPGVIETAHRYGKAVIAGALTPTEIFTASQAGADLVKVFPANHFGPGYFKDVLAPMPHLRLTPTGGVDLETAPAWLGAGAVCLGVGSALVRKDFIENEDWAGLSDLARQYRDVVDRARRCS